MSYYRNVKSNLPVNKVLCNSHEVRVLEAYTNISKHKLLVEERKYILANKEHCVNKNLPMGKYKRKNREAYLEYNRKYNLKRKKKNSEKVYITKNVNETIIDHPNISKVKKSLPGISNINAIF